MFIVSTITNVLSENVFYISSFITDAQPMNAYKAMQGQPIIVITMFTVLSPLQPLIITY